MKKINIAMIMLLVYSLFVPFFENSVEAADTNLINGTPISTGSSYTTVNKNNNTILTDGKNEAVFYWYTTGENVIFHNFSEPMTISQFKMSKMYAGSPIYITISLYDKNGTVIDTRRIDNMTALDTYTYSSPIDNVYGFALHSPSAQYEMYEVMIIGSPTITKSTTTLTTTLTGGSFHLTTPTTVSFGNLAINPNVQTVSKSIGDVELGDLTGNAKGWRLQVQATQLTDGVNTLPLNSLILQSPLSVAAINGTTSAPPSILTGYPWFVDAGSDITILSAGLNQGMGYYLLDFNNPNALTLSIPPSAKQGTYNSTLTWKIVTGP